MYNPAKGEHRDLIRGIADVVRLAGPTPEQYFQESGDRVRDVAAKVRLQTVSMYRDRLCPSAPDR